jgi:hypothetical protein
MKDVYLKIRTMSSVGFSDELNTIFVESLKKESTNKTTYLASLSVDDGGVCFYGFPLSEEKKPHDTRSCLVKALWETYKEFPRYAPTYTAGDLQSVLWCKFMDNIRQFIYTRNEAKKECVKKAEEKTIALVERKMIKRALKRFRVKEDKIPKNAATAIVEEASRTPLVKKTTKTPPAVVGKKEVEKEARKAARAVKREARKALKVEVPVADFETTVMVVEDLSETAEFVVVEEEPKAGHEVSKSLTVDEKPYAQSLDLEEEDEPEMVDCSPVGFQGQSRDSLILDYEENKVDVYAATAKAASAKASAKASQAKIRTPKVYTKPQFPATTPVVKAKTTPMEKAEIAKAKVLSLYLHSVNSLAISTPDIIAATAKAALALDVANATLKHTASKSADGSVAVCSTIMEEASVTLSEAERVAVAEPTPKAHSAILCKAYKRDYIDLDSFTKALDKLME